MFLVDDPSETMQGNKRFVKIKKESKEDRDFKAFNTIRKDTYKCLQIFLTTAVVDSSNILLAIGQISLSGHFVSSYSHFKETANALRISLVLFYMKNNYAHFITNKNHIEKSCISLL